MDKYRHCIPLLLLASILAACTAKYPRLETLEPLPESTNCRIAVFPFTYQGDFPRGENIFYKAFTAELSTFPGLEEVPEGDILQLYKQFRIYPKNQPDERLLPMMAQRLEAQFVVTGDIQKMTEIDTGREVKTELTVLLNIYDGSTGKLLWTTYHKRRGEEYQNVLHYGRVNSLSGLSRRMANEILLLWIENGINQCAP